MRNDVTQLFSNGGMQTHCDTFSCFNQAKWFVGRPDGPYNLLANLCDECKNNLIKSIIELEEENILKILKEIETERITERDKREYGGKKFPCKECGEIFYSPVSLATHVKSAHPKEKK